ncbi:hypothetical protein ScPMuIL_018441 [Solemya velum]
MNVRIIEKCLIECGILNTGNLSPDYGTCRVLAVVRESRVCMNILHAVTNKRETSPAIKKLQASSCPDIPIYPVTPAKAELRKRLEPLQYHVTQDRGTERPFTGKYLNCNEDGVYTCVVCANKLFKSETKFNSGSGWPSFSDVYSKESIKLKEDSSHGMQRLEANCADCGAHIGHVFDDGPKPSKIRYCVNSASLDFKKETTV